MAELQEQERNQLKRLVLPRALNMIDCVREAVQTCDLPEDDPLKQMALEELAKAPLGVAAYGDRYLLALLEAATTLRLHVAGEDKECADNKKTSEQKLALGFKPRARDIPEDAAEQYRESLIALIRCMPLALLARYINYFGQTHHSITMNAILPEP